MSGMLSRSCVCARRQWRQSQRLDMVAWRLAEVLPRRRSAPATPQRWRFQGLRFGDREAGLFKRSSPTFSPTRRGMPMRFHSKGPRCHPLI